MDDRHDPNLILGYVEDELTAADRARVESMLADDPALAALIEDMKRNRETLRGAEPAKPPTDLVEGAMAALERQMLFDDAPPSPYVPAQPTRRFRLVPIVIYGGIAAVLALTATVVIQSLQSGDESPATLAMDQSAKPSMSLAEATLEAQRRAAYSVELDDLETESNAAALASSKMAEGSTALSVEPATEAYAEAAPLAGADVARKETPAVMDDLALAEEAVTATTVADDIASTPQDEVAPASPTPVAVVASRAAGQSRDQDAAPAASLALADGVAIRKNAAASASPPPAVQTPGPANVALDSFDMAEAPRQRVVLNVATAAPERSVQQLNDWALSNRVAVNATPSHESSQPLAFNQTSSRAVQVAVADELTTDEVNDEAELGVGDEAEAEPRRSLVAPELSLGTAAASADAYGDRSTFFRDMRLASGFGIEPQRLQLVVAPNQVAELVAVLSDEDTEVRQDAFPTEPWMQWQNLTQSAEVEVVIEPIVEAAESTPIAPATIPPPPLPADGPVE